MNEPAPRALPASAGRLSLRRGGGLLLAGLTALCVWRLSADPGSLAERLSDGCADLDACRQLEAEAALREQSCWLGCGRREAEHRFARSLRYRAEERSAVREHYRQRDDAERSERQLRHEQRVAEPCIGKDRADLVLAGCAILEGLLRMWPAKRLRVADRGLREGMLATMMAEDGHYRGPQRPNPRPI